VVPRAKIAITLISGSQRGRSWTGQSASATSSLRCSTVILRSAKIASGGGGEAPCHGQRGEPFERVWHCGTTGDRHVTMVPVARRTHLVIFDCDGVLVDSDRLSLRIQAEAITDLGWPMSFEDCVREFLGIGMPATLRRIEERTGRPIPEGWESALEQRVYEAFKHELEPVPGIVGALNHIRVPTCVASSGTHQKMRFTLGLTNLYARFEGRIFSASDVERGKPAPDLFLLAARTMGVEPSGCLVVEDSPAGVEAARAAGMRVLAYAATTPREWLARDGVIVFDDMSQLPDLIAS
jgi:HAD superfamily hydrolase (TIGR01509 family)